MGNQFTVSGGGELDNGLNISVSYQLDNGTPASGPFDDHSITISSDEIGTIKFSGHGGSSATSAMDATAAGDLWGTFDEMSATLGVAGLDMAAAGGTNNNIYYTAPSLMDGLTINASYNPQAGNGVESETGYGVTYTGMEGITVGYGQGDVEQTTGTQSDESTLFATYAIGGATVGIQKSERDNENASDVESTGIGISYQVNDDLTVSYGSNTREKIGSDDQEAVAIGASYTVGSLGIAVSMHQVDNVNNTDADDREGYQMVLTFAF